MGRNSKKITPSFILFWIFSIFLIFSGLAFMIVSFVGGFVIILSGAIIFPPLDKLIEEKYNFHLNKVLKFFAVIILFGVGISLTVSSEDYTSNNLEIQPTNEIQQEEASNEQNEEPNEPAQADQLITNGIRISRNYLIEIFEDPALGYSFEEGLPINGQPNYVGSGDFGLIQLIGSEEDLIEASIQIYLGSDVGDNILAGLNLAGFAKIIDENSVDWVQQQFEIIAEDSTKNHENSKIMNSRNFKISFVHIEGFANIITLTVEPI